MPATATIQRQFFSPPEVARLLGVKHEKVLAYIRTGDLAAADLSIHRRMRPRYRISRDALDDFLARRSATPPPKVQRTRRKPADGVIRFY